MTRERKTVDTWEFHVDYGFGWEHEITEFSFQSMRKNAKLYRENVPYPLKIVRKRMKKSDMTPNELNEASNGKTI